jgi:hypothetical protein
VRSRYRAIAIIVVGALAACGHAPASPTVPRLSGGVQATGTPSGGASGNGKDPFGIGGAESTDSSAARKAKLHAAAECIRQHGVPTYQDPVLMSDGHVFTDARSLQDADEPTIEAVQSACHTLIAAAQFQPGEQAPAPPKLVQAGVKAAQCLRANGLPNMKDPTSTSIFTPGHGFGLTPDEIPAGGKENPVVQHAFGACRPLLDEETRQSTLESLGNA